MGKELTIWTAAKEVSTAVTAVVNTYRSFRMIRKQDMIALRAKIDAFTVSTRNHEAAETIRCNIREIAATQHCIDQQNLTGVALEMAMEQLYELNRILKENMNLIRR